MCCDACEVAARVRAGYRAGAGDVHDDHSVTPCWYRAVVTYLRYKRITGDRPLVRPKPRSAKNVTVPNY